MLEYNSKNNKWKDLTIFFAWKTIVNLSNL